MTDSTTSSAASYSEEQLVSMLKAQDERVLSVLYERYSIALFGTIYRVVGDQKLAEEQLQETFLKIWNYADRYDASKGRLYTWMVRIARNAAIDMTRTKQYKKSQKIQDLEDSVTVIERAKKIEIDTDAIGIRELVNELNTKYAQIINTLYFRGYTQAEAAEELNIPLGTVKTRARKALDLLKQYLTD